ncbi:LytTR family DNA-binding domain-containing protein [Acidobacteriota bacterium]
MKNSLRDRMRWCFTISSPSRNNIFPALIFNIIKKGDEIQIIPEEEVFYFSGEDKYVYLHTRDKRYFFDMTLKELDESLDPTKFCRIHKSWIIALDKIEKMKKWFHGEYMVELKDYPDTLLKVSRSYKSKLQEKLKF